MKTKLMLVLLTLLLVIGIVPAIAGAQSTPVVAPEFGVYFHPTDDGYGVVWAVGGEFPNVVGETDELYFRFFQGGAPVGSAHVIRRDAGLVVPDEKTLLGNSGGFGIEVRQYNHMTNLNLSMSVDYMTDDGSVSFEVPTTFTVAPHIWYVDKCRKPYDGPVVVAVRAQYFTARPANLKSIKMKIGGVPYPTSATQDRGFTVVTALIPKTVWDAGVPGAFFLDISSSRPLVLHSAVQFSKYGELRFCS